MAAFFQMPDGAGDVEAGAPPAAPRRLADRASPLRCGLAAAVLAVLAVVAVDTGRGGRPARTPATALRSAALLPPPPPLAVAEALPLVTPAASEMAAVAAAPAPEGVEGAANEAPAAESAAAGAAAEKSASAAAAEAAPAANAGNASPAEGAAMEDSAAEPGVESAAAPAIAPEAKPETPGAGSATPVEAAVEPATSGGTELPAAVVPAADAHTLPVDASSPLADTSAPAAGSDIDQAPDAPSFPGSEAAEVAVAPPSGVDIDAATTAPDLIPLAEDSATVSETKGEMASKIFMDASVIMMPPGEVAACVKILSDLVAAKGSKISYLEYGSGGSTTEFTQFASTAVSIEHDKEWRARVGKRLVAKGMAHVHQLCVPKEEGEAGRSGRSEGNGVSFRTYLNAVDTPGLPTSSYDFVYIDGRARLGAALKALPYITDESIVVLHDAVRKRYDGVDAYYETVKTVLDWGLPALQKNGLRIMRRRRDLPVGSWPLSDAQIDEVYSSMPDNTIES